MQNCEIISSNKFIAGKKNNIGIRRVLTEEKLDSAGDGVETVSRKLCAGWIFKAEYLKRLTGQGNLENIKQEPYKRGVGI